MTRNQLDDVWLAVALAVVAALALGGFLLVVTLLSGCAAAPPSRCALECVEVDGYLGGRFRVSEMGTLSCHCIAEP